MASSTGDPGWDPKPEGTPRFQSPSMSWLAMPSRAFPGATPAFQIHPRDSEGVERLDADVVDQVLASVRDAGSVPVGVISGAWIETDTRTRNVRGWTAPDYGSVDLSEDGSVEIKEARSSQVCGGNEPHGGRGRARRASRASSDDGPRVPARCPGRSRARSRAAATTQSGVTIRRHA